MSTSPTEEQRTVALLEELEKLGAHSCPDCSRSLCAHEYVLNVAMGFRNEPRCSPCLAKALEREHGEFIEQLREYIDRRACYRTGFEWASKKEADCPWA